MPQQYCCTGFLPPPHFSQDFNLLGQDTDTKVVDLSQEQYPDHAIANAADVCPDISLLVDANGADVIDATQLLQADGIYKRSASGIDLFFICYVSNTISKKLKVVKGTAGPSKQKAKAGLGPAKPASNKKSNTVGKGKLYGQ